MQSLPQSLLGYRFVNQCINTSLISSMPVITSGGANMGGASLFTAITTMSITPSPILSPSTVSCSDPPNLIYWGNYHWCIPPSYPMETRGENLEAGIHWVRCLVGISVEGPWAHGIGSVCLVQQTKNIQNHPVPRTVGSMLQHIHCGDDNLVDKQNEWFVGLRIRHCKSKQDYDGTPWLA